MMSLGSRIGWSLYGGAIAVVGIATAIAFHVSQNSITAWFAPVLVVLVCLALRFPEVMFVLFVNAGAFKADPRLELFQQSVFDLTLFFEVLCVAGIVFGILKRRIKVFSLPRRMLVPFLVLAGLSMFSLMYTEAPLYGREKLIRFLFITSFSLFGPWFLFQNFKCIKRFLGMWVVLSIAMSLDVLTGGLTPGEFMFRSAFESSGYLGLGSVTAQTILILLFLFFPTAAKIRFKLVILGLVILNAFSMLISGARTSPIALLVVTVVILLFTIGHLGGDLLSGIRLRQPNVRIAKITTGMLLVMVILGVLGHGYFTTFQDRMGLLVQEPEQYAGERLDMFLAAAEATLIYPWGLGIGGFSPYYFGFDAQRGGFPHNIFLEVGSELGLLGLVAFVLLCYWTVVRGVRALKAATGDSYFIGTALLSLFAFMLFYFQFHGDINDARALFTWCGSLFAFRGLVTNGGRDDI